MKIAMFGTKPYDRNYFNQVNKQYQFDITYFEPRLTEDTCTLATTFPTVCLFVNDHLTAEVAQYLGETGTQLIALRCAGFNNVNLKAVHDQGMKVVRVPAYSPHAVAEHTLALILTLNRKVHRSYNRVREGNFALDGLLGFDLYSRTIGVIGTGKIGEIFASIMIGLGCKVVAYDPYPNPACEQMGVEYTDLDNLLQQSDVISLHCPLVPQTKHIINQESISKMKDGAMLINTSRGALIDTRAVIDGLKDHKIGYLGLDVYEEEDKFFFENRSEEVLEDDVFARLLTFPNVVITGHQAFFTHNAMHNIAETTLQNIYEFDQGMPLTNEVKVSK